LDCIFQHIPVKSAAPSGKKKDAELLPEAEAAAKASKDAIVVLCCHTWNPFRQLGLCKWLHLQDHCME